MTRFPELKDDDLVSVASLETEMKELLIGLSYDHIFTMMQFFDQIEDKKYLTNVERAAITMDNAMKAFVETVTQQFLDVGFCTNEFIEWCEDAGFWKHEDALMPNDSFFDHNANGF